MANREAVVYDVLDCKVYPLTSDSGASPTFGTGVDVYGIADASFEPNFVSNELKGDSRIIAKKSRVDRFNFSLTYGRLSLDVLEVVLGGEVTTVAGDHERWRYVGGGAPPYFGLGLMMDDLDNDLNALHVIGYKVKITGGTLLGQSSDNFGQPTIDCEAIALDCAGGPWEGVMADVDFYSVDTDLPATLAS